MKIVLIYSGGMDSTVALYLHRHLGDEVIPIGIDYGQRHRKELNAARDICKELGIEYRIVDLTVLKRFLTGSSQTDDSVPVPEGHYAEESMKATVVPNRNMIMLSVAVGIAISEKADAVAYAAHSGDHAIYPDCRPEFVDALRDAVWKADWHKVRLLTPFINMSKTDIAIMGKRLGVPFEKTWSCYKGGSEHCGKCGTCVERNEALFGAGLIPMHQSPTDPRKQPELSP